MKKILLTIIGMILIFPSISNAAKDELIWKTEKFGGINDIELSNTTNVFYNTFYSKIQIRNLDNGELLDSINFESYFNKINKISITQDDRYIAVSGDNPNLIIWDMVNKQIYKKFTKVIFEGDSAHFWKSASISPDGTKVTAIGVIEFSAIASELVVFDIETGETLLSEPRNSYDKINGVYYGPQWVSTEFSPNGEYLVTELSVNWDHQSGQVLLDSVYVYRTNDYKINDTFLNNFDEKDIAFSSYENVISSNHGNTLRIYNLDTKESKSKTFNSYLNSIVFSREGKELIFMIGQSAPIIYNYKNDVITYNYETFFTPNKITKDNSIILGYSLSISKVRAKWDGVTGVSQNEYGINFTLSPNPATNTINIYLNSDGFEYTRLSIVDLLGNEVGLIEGGLLNTSNYQKDYDVSDLPPSTYFIRLEIGNEVVTKQFIKE